MKAIEAIYVLSALLSVIAMLPQINKLRATKNSDEFDVWTWFIWTFGQVCGLAYSITIGAYAYLLVSAVWIAFYAYMVTLIIKYRPSKRLATEAVETLDYSDATLEQLSHLK